MMPSNEEYFFHHHLVFFTLLIIEQKEYFELTQHCRKLGLEITKPPPWVKNRSDFLIWEFELDYDVPSRKHKELSDIESIARAKLNAAMQSGASDDEVNILHLEAFKAGNDVSEFIDRYLPKDYK